MSKFKGKYIAYTKEKGKIETSNWDDIDNLTYHREDGPAFQEFHDNGQLQRKAYYINGKQHRLDGPAFQSFTVSGELLYEAYCINGKDLTFEEWQVKVKAKTIEVKSKADLEKQAKKDKGDYIDGSDYYVSTTGNKPIVYSIKESKIFESFTEFYENINEGSKDYTNTVDGFLTTYFEDIHDDDWDTISADMIGGFVIDGVGAHKNPKKWLAFFIDNRDEEINIEIFESSWSVEHRFTLKGHKIVLESPEVIR